VNRHSLFAWDGSVLTKESNAAAKVEAGTPAPAGRRRDLDFYRGFTVIQMVAAHLMMRSVSPMHGDETLRLFFFSYAELFSAGFLMLAGINVGFTIDKARNRPNFRLTRFFALASFGLFFMGWSYNLLEGTGPFVSVVQAIGIGVFVTYILLRVGFPTWALGAAACLGFLDYYLAVGAQLTIDPAVESGFFWHLLIGHGEMTREGLRALWPSPYFFAMFGLIPAASFVVFGVFIERLRGRWLVAWCVLLVALTVVSHLLPGMTYNPKTYPVLRADFKFLLQILPLYTGWLLIFRYLYPKVRQTALTRAVEYFGRFSLDFLVFHWIFIHLVSLLTPTLGKGASFQAVQWARAAIVLFLLWITLPRLEQYRSRISKTKGFLTRAWVVLLSSFGAAMVGVMANLIPLRLAAGVVAALTFTLMYPAQRASWRRSCAPE